MADLPKSIPTMAFAHQQPSDFVALDITNLAAVADHDSGSNSSPRVIKNFSRKGSLRLGGDNKKLAPIEGDATAFANSGGTQVHVAGDDESISLYHATTPTAGGGKYRRLGSNRRVASSPWVDPRRILFVFATLSSFAPEF